MRIFQKTRPAVSLLELVVAIAIFSILVGLTLSGIQRVRASAARSECQNKLRQTALAMHTYHQTAGQFPSGVSPPDKTESQPYLSWCARLLPYLEQQAMWSDTLSAFAQDRNFLDVPPHYGLETAMPIFACPSDSRVSTAQVVPHTDVLRAFTSYLGVIGYNSSNTTGILYMGSATKIADITDGLSNTLMIGERPPSADLVMGWWYAGWGQVHSGELDMVLGVRTKNLDRYGPGCPEGAYHFTAGAFTNQCDMFHFWSPHVGGGNFAMADGSVQLIQYSADPIMPALASRAGGEAISLDD